MSAPDDKRCAELAAKYDVLAGFFEKMIAFDPEAQATVDRNRDIAAALRAIPKVRAHVADMAKRAAEPNSGYTEYDVIKLTAILGATETQR